MIIISQNSVQMPNKFLDTNQLARFILNDVSEQAQIVKNLMELSLKSDFRLVIIPEVIIELNYVLLRIYQMDKILFVTSVKKILNLSSVICDDKSIKIGIELYQSKNLSLEDCYYIAYCLTNQLEFTSFDRKATNLYQSLLNQPI